MTMGTFKNLIEPGAIAFIFTAGTLINRRKQCYARLPQISKDVSPTSSRTSSPDHRRTDWLPDNAVFCNNILSRFLAAFPFLLEIWYWLLTYWIYQLARAYSAHLIRDSLRTHQQAERHAVFLLSLERSLGLNIELSLQQSILSRAPWLMPILAKIYYSHIIVGVTFLVYAYTHLPRPVFRRIRRTIAMDNLIAFVIFTVWRCAPPRLMPPEYGYMDVLHPRKGLEGETWSNNHFQLTLAAMPSLHFGTSLFIAICLITYSPHRPLRVLAPLWPAAMLLTILATANHWVLDAVVGAFVPILGWRWQWVFASRALEVLEEWGFWACRTEKPVSEEHALLRDKGREWIA